MKFRFIVTQLVIISILCSCSTTAFIDDGNGHKQYKDKNGNIVKSEWVDLNGKYYYFDRNGYLATNQWIDDEYFVDENGIMKTNYWYEGESGYYYLDNEGKYLRNTIKEIDGNFYAFDLNGINIKNAPYIVDGEGYYFGNDGKADKQEGWKDFLGTYCYVKEDGKLLINDWKEDGDKKYYLNELGLMAKNSFVDGNYYVDENGEMVKDKELKLGTDIYIFDGEGKSSFKGRRINKQVTWNKHYTGKALGYDAYYISNEWNTNDNNKQIMAKYNGKQTSVDITVKDSTIIFTIVSLWDDERVKALDYDRHKRQAVLKTEQNEQITIWYWKGLDGLCYGEGGYSKQTYERLLSLLCKSEDTKYTIYFPELKLTLESEINVGNFNSVYSQFADKAMWS